ncbi:MAG: FkbM family methyltransferase [Bacteroidota bacterium]
MTTTHFDSSITTDSTTSRLDSSTITRFDNHPLEKFLKSIKIHLTIMIHTLYKLFRKFIPLQKFDINYVAKRVSEYSFIKSVETFDDHVIAVFNNDVKLKVRDYHHSDYPLFRQIFYDEEYKKACALVEKHFRQNPVVIIDAGANVGYSSIYFKTKFPNSVIYAVEPSAQNADLIRQNVALSQFTSDIHVYERALTGKSGIQFDISTDFRDHKSWSTTTVESPAGLVKGITLNELVDENKLSHISLLKIDIEGAERFVFGPEANLDFLKKTYVVAIEIHDEFNCRDSIYQILHSNGFELAENGETVFGLNTRFLQT